MREGEERWIKNGRFWQVNEMEFCSGFYFPVSSYGAPRLKHLVKFAKHVPDWFASPAPGGLIAWKIKMVRAETACKPDKFLRDRTMVLDRRIVLVKGENSKTLSCQSKSRHRFSRSSCSLASGSAQFFPHTADCPSSRRCQRGAIRLQSLLLTMILRPLESVDSPER